jgi:hypothetical protein
VPALLLILVILLLVAAVAFLQGLASQELSPFELEHHDPRFPLVIAARVVKELNA